MTEKLLPTWSRVEEKDYMGPQTKYIENGSLDEWGNNKPERLNAEYRMHGGKTDNWLGRKAQAEPGKIFYSVFQEGWNRYTGFIVYDQERDVLECWGAFTMRCPGWVYHHVGSTCKYCGMRD